MCVCVCVCVLCFAINITSASSPNCVPAHFSLLHEVRYHLLCVVDSWKQILDGSLVDPVEVDSSQGGSVVAHDNAIRVHHGNYLEHTVAAKALRKEGLSHDYHITITCLSCDHHMAIM